MKDKFDKSDVILEPNWLAVPAKTEREIEMYARKVELLNASAALMRRTHKNSAETPAERHQLNFTESC